MLKENCHFYTEYPDMGGRIPCCTRYTQLGKCPCDNCNLFLDEVDAQKIIKKYSDGELIPLDVLDKIRAEIDKWHHLTDKAFNDGIDTALEIIDKYKAESEDKE